MLLRAAVVAAAVLTLAPAAPAQTPAGGGPRPAPIPVPQSSGFSITVPTRGGYVTVPLSPSGEPLVPDGSAQIAPAPPVPPGVPAPAAPPAPPSPPGAADGAAGDGYQVIDPRATSPQPPAVGSGFFVVPRP